MKRKENAIKSFEFELSIIKLCGFIVKKKKELLQLLTSIIKASKQK